LQSFVVFFLKKKKPPLGFNTICCLDEGKMAQEAWF